MLEDRSRIKNAGRVAVLDEGHLVELGSHDELVEKGRLYARLWRHQFRRDGE